eukprot:1427128-Rhodomonas_salina.1
MAVVRVLPGASSGSAAAALRTAAAAASKPAWRQRRRGVAGGGARREDDGRRGGARDVWEGFEGSGAELAYAVLRVPGTERVRAATRMWEAAEGKVAAPYCPTLPLGDVRY